VGSSQRLGRHRWVVECTISWLLAFRRLATRYDRGDTTITAVAILAITVICARRLARKDY
jgi:transposase